MTAEQLAAITAFVERLRGLWADEHSTAAESADHIEALLATIAALRSRLDGAERAVEVLAEAVAKLRSDDRSYQEVFEIAADALAHEAVVNARKHTNG